MYSFVSNNMTNLSTKGCFVAYMDCSVVYDGRAHSTLERGNYLIIFKPDGSLSVHGAVFAKPLNYQNGGTRIETYKSGSEFNDLVKAYFGKKPAFILFAMNNGEVLAIAVYKVIKEFAPKEWSANKIALSRSEKELVQQIFDNIYAYFPKLKICGVEVEVPTPYGNVDILIGDTIGSLHIVEVKRKIVSVAACGQVARYGKFFRDEHHGEVMEYLAAPRMTSNARAYADRHDQQYVFADFDIQPRRFRK